MNTDKMDKKMKVLLITGISFVSIVLMVTIASAFSTPEAPDPKQLSPRKKVAYMATKQFARLPEKQKEQYMRKVGHSRRMFRNLNQKERQAVFKNTRKIMHKRMKEHMNKFFQMSQEEQNKFLDNMIAQHERMRKMREAREAQRAQNGSNNNRRQDGPPRGNHKAMLQGMLENTDSTSRAQMAEFHRRMEARRKATQGK
jgi:hypothetical protein